MLTEAQRQSYEEDGYLVVSGLFRPEEAAAYIEHYMDLRAQGAWPGDTAGVDIGGDDPIKRYPRMIHMHRWDDISLKWLLEPRLRTCMAELLGRDPYAVQTMLYFKPAGARGQALHQDQFYLRVNPGTCMAAWMALDACDEDNGCMRLVPGSHKWPILCTEEADVSVSFTDITVPVPPGTEVRAVRMAPGDVLFFNGSVIHGSYPNTTTDRFRRSLIGHYIEGQAEQVGKFYSPVLRMDDGSELSLKTSPGGGVCGVWVDKTGQPVIELAGEQVASRGYE
jgi:ectoine hydroxylase-related dioxygenase (phytanoyl-CoA dioxygenase family)